jgi:hypothetical protein
MTGVSEWPNRVREACFLRETQACLGKENT